MRNKISRAIATTLLFAGLSQAQALTINFSGESSDATDPGLLTATMDLDVTIGGATSGSDLLTVTINNLSDTSGQPGSQNGGFTLSEAFFNFAGNNSLLSLDPSPQGDASLSINQSAGGFGTFDVQLDFGPGNAGLLPNTTGSWTIDLGTTGVSIADFELLSDSQPGNNPQLAALFFSKGPCDPEITGSCVEDSAYSSPVPIPAAVWFFGSGLIALSGLARKKTA